MLSPFVQLVEGVLIVDRVDENADVGVLQEQVGQVMCCCVTGRVPNDHSKLMFIAVGVLDLLYFHEVLHNLGCLLFLTPLGATLHK